MRLMAYFFTTLISLMCSVSYAYANETCTGAPDYEEISGYWEGYVESYNNYKTIYQFNLEFSDCRIKGGFSIPDVDDWDVLGVERQNDGRWKFTGVNFQPPIHFIMKIEGSELVGTFHSGHGREWPARFHRVEAPK